MKGTKKRNVKLMIDSIILVFIALVFMFPVLYMFNMSFMTKEEVRTLPVSFWPKSYLNFANYAKALDASFIRYFLNTAYVIAFNMIIGPVSCMISAYSFCKLKWKGRDIVFSICMASMLLPGAVTSIPIYVIYVKLGWINTLNPLTIPAIFGAVSTVFLIMQYMKGIPNDLLNAAKIDGANALVIFYKMMMPMCSPIYIYVLVGTFNGCWNQFIQPLMYLRSEKLYTLPVGIYMKFSGNYSETNFPNIQMATCCLMSIVSLVIFAIFQNQLVEGVKMGGLKG